MRDKRLIHIALYFLLTACGASDSDIEESAVEEENQIPREGEVRFLNLIPDSPDLIVGYAAQQFTAPFAGGSALTSILVGEYELDVVYTDVNGDTEFLVEDLERSLFNEDQDTFLFFGSLDNFDLQIVEQIKAEFLDEDGIEGDDAEIWWVMGATSVPAVDVYLTGPGANLFDAAPVSTLLPRGYTEVSVTSSETERRIRITEQGSVEVLYDSGPFELTGGERTLFAIVDYFGPDGGIEVVQLIDSGRLDFPSPVLPTATRVVNAVSDQLSFDVYFGSTNQAPFVADLNFGAITKYTEFDDENLNTSINVTPPGIVDRFIHESNLDFVAGTFSTLVIAGNSADDSVTSTVILDTRRRITDRSRVQFINASANAGVVNGVLSAPAQPVDDVAPQFANQSLGGTETAILPPSTYDFVALNSFNGTFVFGPLRVELAPGGIYTIVLTDVEGGGGGTTAVLLDDFTSQEN